MADIIFGAVKDPKDTRDYLTGTLLEKGKLSTPTASSVIDWTSEMTPIKNQSSLGSCVAFAICAVKEWQEKTEQLIAADNIKNYDLSEQWLYYKCKEIDPWPNIQGTAFRYAMRVMAKEGVPVEQGWNYDTKTKGEPEKWAAGVASWYKSGAYWRISNLAELKLLLNLGPQAIGILCFKGIFSPVDGVISKPGRKERALGGHAVCVCGYNDETGLLKIKNSWGSNWGQEGYGYISYDYYKSYCLDAWYFADSTIEQASKPKEVKMAKEIKKVPVQKIKLINKKRQLQILHINENGKDTTLRVVSGAMITVRPDQMSGDIRNKIQKGLLEKK